MLYLFYVLTNLLYWWTFGFPSNVLVVSVWVGSIVAEVFLTCCEDDRLTELLGGKVFHVKGGRII